MNRFVNIAAVFSIVWSPGIVSCKASVDGSGQISTGGVTVSTTGGSTSQIPGAGGTVSMGSRVLENIAVSGTRLNVPRTVVEGQVVPLSIGKSQAQLFDTKRNQTCTPQYFFGGYYCVPQFLTRENDFSDSSCTQALLTYHFDGIENGAPLWVDYSSGGHLFESLTYTGEVYRSNGPGNCNLIAPGVVTSVRYYKRGAELTKDDFAALKKIEIPLFSRSDPPKTEIAAVVFEGADGSRVLQPTLNFNRTPVLDETKSYFVRGSISFADKNCSMPVFAGAQDDIALWASPREEGYTANAPLRAFRPVGSEYTLAGGSYLDSYGGCIEIPKSESRDVFNVEELPLEKVPFLLRHRSKAQGIGLDYVEGNGVKIPTFAVREGVPCVAQKRTSLGDWAWYCGRRDYVEVDTFRDDKCQKPIGGAAYTSTSNTWKVGDLVREEKVDYVNNKRVASQFRVSEFSPVYGLGSTCEKRFPNLSPIMLEKIEPVSLTVQ